MRDLFRTVRSFIPYLSRNQKILFLITIGVGILWFITEIFFALIIQAFFVSVGLIDGTKANLPHWFPMHATSTIILIVVFGGVRAVVMWMRTFVVLYSNAQLLKYVRQRVFEISLTNAGTLSTRDSLTAFGETANQGAVFFQNFSTFMITSIAAFSLFLYGLTLSWKLMTVSFLVLAVFILPLRLFSKAFDVRGKLLIGKLKLINETLLIGIRNYFLLNLYGLTAREVAAGKKLLNEYQQVQKEHFIYYGLTGAFPFFVGIIVISIGTWINIEYKLEEGAVLLSFFYIFLRFSQTLADAKSAASYMSFNRRFVEELRSFFHEYSPRSELARGGQGMGGLFSSDKLIDVEFDDVSFGYRDDDRIFEAYNMKIATGNMFLVKGPSGAGKSTFLKLLAGFVQPTKGKVLVNGRPLTDVRKSFSEIVSYIGAEPYIIPASLKDNLLYAHPGHESVSSEEMWKALDRVGLKSAFERSGIQLETRLMEDSQISTGQRQRLSFARAMLRRPKILILDEATANLDVKTEGLILNWLQETKASTVQIVVTHGASFDKFADQVLSLEPKA